MKMKKKLAIIPFLLIVLTGCGRNNLTVLTCTNLVEVNENTRLSTEFMIFAEGDEVVKLTSTETIKTEDSDLLAKYRQALEEISAIYNQVPFFENSMFENDGLLTIITMVNYRKINFEDLIRINPNNESLVENGRVSLRLLRELYDSTGAVCE